MCTSAKWPTSEPIASRCARRRPVPLWLAGTPLGARARRQAQPGRVCGGDEADGTASFCAEGPATGAVAAFAVGSDEIGFGFRIARPHVAQEIVERVFGRRRVGDVLEILAAAAERGRDDLEGARVGRAGHLRGVSVAEALEPELVLGERVADLGAQNVRALDIGQRLPLLPAVAIHQLDLLGRFAPLVRRPVDIGAKPDRQRAP